MTETNDPREEGPAVTPEPAYDIREIVSRIRHAGNPQMAAIQAIADTDGLEDAELLDALGVERWGDLPTTPYQDPDSPTADPAKPLLPADERLPCRKPGPKPGSRRARYPTDADLRKADGDANLNVNLSCTTVAREMDRAAREAGLADMRRGCADKRRAELERSLKGLTEFGNVWCKSTTMTHSPFDKADEKAILRLHAKATAYLRGWDNFADILDGKF